MRSNLLVSCFIFLLLFSIKSYTQIPIIKWDYSRISTSFQKQFLHGYNVGVSLEGFVFTSTYHNEQFPLMECVDLNGKYKFAYQFNKPTLADAIFKIRTESNDIYKNSVEDVIYDYYQFGIQTTWTDEKNIIYYPMNISFSRLANERMVNLFQNFTYEKNEYFHSMLNSQINFDTRLIARSEIISTNDTLFNVIRVYQLNRVGSITLTIDSFTVGKIYINEIGSFSKPKALRWHPKNGQWPHIHKKDWRYENLGKLGMMISADTVIPTSNTVTQVRFTQMKDSNSFEKFDEVVDVNPYLVENFAGERLIWKGFTNSSFGFVALYENIDNNNQNILIRYNSATQTFTTVPLDVSVDCRSLCIDSIGALAIVGTKNVSGNNDFYLGFFNSSGELSEQSWGGDEYDRLNDCVIDSLGEIAVSGQKGNDLYLAKFTFNATSVSDKGKNSLSSIFVHQPTSSSTNELVVDNLPTGKTTIRMFTMQGTFVGTIYEGMIMEGASYRFPLPSSSISNGVYLIVLENNGITQTKQFVLVK